MGRVLGGFQDQVVRQLVGRLPQRRSNGRWEYSLAEAAKEESGFDLMETYIRRRQNIFAKYILTQPILDLCEVEEWKQGNG